jgi:hypothetical protein
MGISHENLIIHHSLKQIKMFRNFCEKVFLYVTCILFGFDKVLQMFIFIMFT